MTETGPVVFDFDKTLTYRDTLAEFFAACGRGKFLFRARFAAYWAVAGLSRLGLVSNRALKHAGVRLFLSGMTRAEIVEAGAGYAAAIRLNRIHSGEFLGRFPDAYVVSGSFSEYLGHLFREERLFGSRILYEDGRAVGVDVNCYQGKKAELLRERGISRIGILYTDSGSDLALAEMADRVYLVRGDRIIPCDSLADFKRRTGRRRA